MRHPSAYLKMRVLGAIDNAEGSSIRDRIKKVSQLVFHDEQGQEQRFTWRTISTWLYRYKISGLTGVQPKTRLDKGATRKITPEELLEAINQVLPFFREKHYNRMDIYRACIEKGVLTKAHIAQTTFYRFVRTYELLNPGGAEHNKRRLAFAMQYANQLWQADTMYGPYVATSGEARAQTRLIAFLDDASRVICHGEFFLAENISTMTSALKSAFYKRGIPEQLYVDHGSIYTCKEITLICARVGCILRHAPLRDGAAKGKIERFFRRLRDQFLSRVLDLSSIEALNKQFTSWVEEQYNAVEHSALGLKPIDRFALDLKRIKFLPPSELTDELFYSEEERTVKKDNTFSFSSLRYEAPAACAGRLITIRFDRQRKDRLVVYHKDQRLGEARPVDLIANGLLRRTSPKEARHD